MADNIYSFIHSTLNSLEIKLDKNQVSQLEIIASNMLLDPLYKSVSKISDLQEVAVKHFLDGLAPLHFNYKFWAKDNLKIVDLGTGGGFPAFPLSVAIPNSSVLAVDSRKKSADFVSRIAEKSGCSNITGLHSRIEDLGRNPKYREKFDLVVCRALAEVRVLLEYCLPLAKKDAYVLFYKGPKLDEEIKIAANAIKTFGITANDYSIEQLGPPEFPFKRNFLFIKRAFKIDSQFPRKNGLPKKKPL